MTRKELQDEHIEKMKKLQQKKLHDQIQEKINYNPKEVRKSFDRQARKLRYYKKLSLICVFFIGIFLGLIRKHWKKNMRKKLLICISQLKIESYNLNS